MAEHLHYCSPEFEGGVSEYQYQGSSLQLMRRWEPYRYRRSGDEVYLQDRLDFHNKVIDKLKLLGEETILDVGSADGGVLFELWYNRGHGGRMIGIEPNTDQAGELIYGLQEAGIKSLEIYQDTVQDIRLADSTADYSFFFFGMYHVPPHEQDLAISELKRVTKPEGKIVLSTSSKANKPRHREFERLLARHFGVNPPRRMNEWFTSEIAEQFIPRYFAQFEHLPDHYEIAFNGESVDIYLDSLLSMNMEFRPMPRGPIFERALHNVIKPIMLQEIEQTGYFTDLVRRDAWICTNEK